MTRINLISCPRNLSTALMYSFAQRTDTTVVDEPFYGHYLNVTNANHPGKRDILNSMPVKIGDVLRNILGKNGTPVLFLKNMAHHFIQMDLSFMLPFKNVIFIRNPKQVIASYSRVIEKPTISDIGMEEQFNIYQYLLSNGNRPIVLDSDDLVVNPALILKKLCSELDIPFDGNMLCWKAGPRAEDGIWAEHWYDNVHKSTGFQKQEISNLPIPDHLVSLFDQSIVYYNQLNKLALKT